MIKTYKQRLEHKRREIEQEFEEFWNSYPEKLSKRTAFTAYLQARTIVDYVTIMDELKRYILEKPDHVAWLLPCHFLKERRWENKGTKANEERNLSNEVKA